MGTKRDKFRKALLFTLDESMENIFGKNTVQAVYYHLEKRHLLKLEDILEKPQTFSMAIKEMFGETGAEVIETLLMKDLCARFRIKSQRGETDKLVDFLDGLKITCIEK